MINISLNNKNIRYSENIISSIFVLAEYDLSVFYNFYWNIAKKII